MRHFRLGVVGATAASCAAAVAMTASAAVASTSHSMFTLRNSGSRAAAHTRRVGAVVGSSTIGFEVNLKLRDQQGAVAFTKAVSTPGNKLYRKYLTAKQWEARYSPSASSVEAVTRFLRSSGFKVGKVSADRLAIPASGTAAQVQRAFATTLSLHRVQGHTLRLADGNLSVPAGIAGIVAGVTGVSQTLAHPDNTVGAAGGAKGSQPAPGKPIPQPAGFRAAQPCGSYYGEKTDSTLPPYGNGYPSNPPWAVCGYTPPQFRSAYGLSGADNGAGVTVAIVDAYQSPTLYQDASEYARNEDPGNPLEPSQFSELQTHGFNDVNLCGASGWFGEQTLDVEAVHGTAPGANILFAGAKNCVGGLNDTLRTIVDGHLANVITNSYGDNAGDLLDSASDRAATDAILMMADDTGISVLFSSGDSGDEFTTVGQVSPDYPASSPYSTAVGGTTLQVGADGSRTGEFGWSTARSFLCDSTWESLGNCTADQEGQWLPIDESLDGGSGGGTSYVYPQPSYQAGVVPTSLSEANGSSTPMRVEPDIAMEADPATGMLVGETQTFPDGTYYDVYRIGGTSVASPLFAGVVARADETAGHALGFLNPALYSLASDSSTSNSPTAALYDIGPAGQQDMSRADYVNSIDSSQGLYFTTRIIDYEGQEQFCSSSTTCSTRNVALNAVAGYDNMTGLGSPNDGFIPALTAASAASAASHK